MTSIVRGGGGGGGGTKAPISVSLTSLSFGEQAVGSTSAAKTVTIGNTGRTNVQISSIVLNGNGAASFSHTTTCPETLASKANCTVSVQFSPSTATAAAASLDISVGSTYTAKVALSESAVTGVGASPSSSRFAKLSSRSPIRPVTTSSASPPRYSSIWRRRK